MRTTAKIVEATKDGERPDYEELRYTVLVLDFFVNMLMTSLSKKAAEDKKFYLVYSTHFKSLQSAFNVDPKSFISKDDPDNLEYQERRKKAKIILKKFMERNKDATA